MSDADVWLLSGSGPEIYENFQVPSMFGPLARIFLKHVDLQPGLSVLDVACGTGIVSRYLAPIVGNEGRVVGTDFNADMLEVAARSVSGSSLNIEWQQGDATALPFSADEFDAVVSQQGLQFFGDRALALGEMHRVLKPGGRLAICVWRSSEHCPLIKATGDAVGRFLGAESARTSLAPLSLGSADELDNLMDSAGFQNVEIKPITFVREMRPPTISIPEALASTPLGPKIAALDEATRSAIVSDISSALAQFCTAEGMSVPYGAHIALAAK